MQIGLVLSGGGARAIVHLGVLQALDELGNPPSAISGVSAGALIAALYASGKSPKEIMALIKLHSRSSLAAAFLLPGGLFSSNGLRNILKSMISCDDFSGLKIPVTVTATDLISGKSVSFSEGSLYEALLGSAAVPGIFDPVKFGAFHLVDGGVLDNLPVTCILGRCDKVLGVHANRLDNQHDKWSRPQVLDRCFHLAVAAKVAVNAKMCDLLIEPDTSGFTMFDTKGADQLFSAGYTEMMHQKGILSSWQS